MIPRREQEAVSVPLPEDPGRRPWDVEPDGPRSRYRADLRDIDRELVAVAEEVASAAPVVIAGSLAGDPAAQEEAGRVDAERRRRCRHLEDRCFVLIAREGPVAADLREIVAVTRAITDLERCSRLLVHIAAAVGTVDAGRLPSPLRRTLRDMADAARRTFTAGVDAWRRRDGLAINELRSLDDEVDRLEEALLSDLYGGELPIEDVVAIALLSRFFERLADHGVALGAHISWAVTGDRVGSAT